MNLFGVVFPKYIKLTSTNLVNKCFEIRWWIPLTMVTSLPLNSALLEIKISAPVFHCSYASSIIDKILTPLTIYKFCGFYCHLQIPSTFSGIHWQLRNPEQIAFFACCGIRGTTIVPTKITLHVFVRGIHGSFVSGFH